MEDPFTMVEEQSPCLSCSLHVLPFQLLVLMPGSFLDRWMLGSSRLFFIGHTFTIGLPFDSIGKCCYFQLENAATEEL
jgi:hypothetical protein